MIGVLLAMVGCTATPVERVEGPSVISYAGAASWLRGMDLAETQEQLRDWAQIGLASHLGLDAARLRDAAYDVVPVRDPAFADLSRQSTGPGRALFDGRGVLHVLVARDDPHESRTIGLLIDQYRADAGADPPQVEIDHYQARPDTQTIELTPERPAPTSEVRSAHGFVTMRVNETGQLADFLAKTRHLSWLEVRGTEIWAGGWNWPDVPAAPLDIEDVSALQRGYLQPQPDGQLPGFSLDPGPVQTRDDILAVIPGLRPELADRLLSHDWSGSAFQSADELAADVEGALYEHDPAPAALAELGLPSDPSQLWALDLLLDGHAIYSQARTDGLLEGTKVWMTLFYADKVAKDWVAGVGTGVPTRAVEGFVPDSGADTPWSHCAGAEGPKSEYGRLWFGQNDAGFTFTGDRVSIGPQATRLFFRSEANGGTEVESSFGFGRGMRWWDQHYQAVGDYEPQYQRLDQIMRWSGALEWLTSKTTLTLPQLDDAAIRSNLRFPAWYAQHDELRERSPIEFVTPPSAQHDAIRTTPSAVYRSCGLPNIFGGVSLGDLNHRKGGRSFQADNVPGPLRRGGLFDETSSFDPATGSGRINQEWLDGRGQVVDNLERRFSTTAEGHNVVDITGTGREVAPLGDLKVWRAKSATRQYTLDTTVRPGLITQRVEYQNQELGELVTRNNELYAITIQWREGWLDHARRALGSIQRSRMAHPAAGVPIATDGVLFSYQDASGHLFSKIGGPGAPLLSITDDVPPPGEEMALRLGVPNPQTGAPEFFLGRFVAPPELPPTDGEPPWMEVIPPTGDHPSIVVAAGGPDQSSHSVPVTNPDRSRRAVVQVGESGDREWVRRDDPMLGFDGSPEGAALLRDFPRVQAAMHDAEQANDGRLRAVPLDGDGVALASAHEVILVASDHPWAAQVLRAIGPDPSPTLVVFLLKGAQIYHVEPHAELTRAGPVQHATGSDIRARNSDGNYFVHNVLAFEHGSSTPKPLADEDNFIIVPFALTDRHEGAARPQPDVRIHEGEQWWRLSDSGTTGAPEGGHGGGFPVVTGQVYLVCPDTNPPAPGCDQDQ